MINIDKVSKSYGKDQVLDEVGLSIDKGKFTAFIGPNGAGKSTLLSLISRLLPKEKGYLYIKGQEIESWDSLNLAKELSKMCIRDRSSTGGNLEGTSYPVYNCR